MAELPDLSTHTIQFVPLHFSEANLTMTLFMPTAFGRVFGRGEISRSLDPNLPPAYIPTLAGTIMSAGDGSRLLHVRGEYIDTAPAPATGSLTGQFSASATIDGKWAGRGSFIYGHWEVAPCEVSQTQSQAEAEAPLIAAERVPA